MPSMANITVKKHDGTTDIVWSNVTPSAGDRSPAVWKSNTVGTASSHRPEFRIVARDNGPGDARRVEGSGVYPQTVTGTDGKITVANKLPFNFSFLVPKGMPDADVNEATSQFCHLMASALTKECARTGYAPG